MSSGELDAPCEMLCLDMCIFSGCGGGLVLEGAQRVLFGRDPSFGVSGCDPKLVSGIGVVCAGHFCGPLEGQWILMEQA